MNTCDDKTTDAFIYTYMYFQGFEGIETEWTKQYGDVYGYV